MGMPLFDVSSGTVIKYLLDDSYGISSRAGSFESLLQGMPAGRVANFAVLLSRLDGATKGEKIALNAEDLRLALAITLVAKDLIDGGIRLASPCDIGREAE
jgi:hypothetical protein